MNVSEEDAALYYKLYLPLLLYVNKKYDLTDMETPEDVKSAPLKEVELLRNKLFDHPEVIQEFIEENPFDFSPDALDMIREWNHFVKKKFIIFRSLKKYTIFLDIEEEQPKPYGVLALYTPLKEVVGPFPALVETVLLPFKGKIIYDGVVHLYSFQFGRNVRSSFKDVYQRAKFRVGIVESLPFSEKGEKSDEEKLKFYLKSERNRDRFWEEIQELIENPRLLVCYHQEMGKIHARKIGKWLRHVGVAKGWFAILEGVLFACELTRGETRKIVEKIVPEEKWDFVYYFQLKKR